MMVAKFPYDKIVVPGVTGKEFHESAQIETYVKDIQKF